MSAPGRMPRGRRAGVHDRLSDPIGRSGWRRYGGRARLGGGRRRQPNRLSSPPSVARSFGPPDLPVRCWRLRSGLEIDFVIERRRGEVDAIECKWDPDDLNAPALRAFRVSYPAGANFLITPTAARPYLRRVGDLEVQVGGPEILFAERPSSRRTR